MASAIESTQPSGEESAKERVDRELSELLSELRVVLPGVQVLFAFLIGAPFTQRFGELDARLRNVYFVAFLAAGAATALLIAPTTFHRIRFRERDKEHMLQASNAFTLAASVMLAIAMTAVTYVITAMIFDGSVPAIATSAVALMFVSLWYVYPLSRKMLGREPGPSS